MFHVERLPAAQVYRVSSVTDSPKIVLAPMEGLTDFTMRHVLTQLSPYDWCVTEFLRITDRLMPDSVFYRHCPELLSQGRTSNGTPVHFQFLGSDPEMLALNARRAAELGAIAIDLNFGCPAKTVNRHGGGASLLASSQTLHDIVRCVREHVPADVPVSAKMRLGHRFDRRAHGQRAGHLRGGCRLADDPCANQVARLQAARGLGGCRAREQTLSALASDCQWRYWLARQLGKVS